MGKKITVLEGLELAANAAKDYTDKAESRVSESIVEIETRVEELEARPSGGLSDTASRLLIAILSEGVYGTSQEENIALLKEQLVQITVVSIEAELVGEAVVGMSFSDLVFDVTAHYSDDTSAKVTGYRVNSGTVASHNVATVRYGGKTVGVEFDGIEKTVYSVTYNLTNMKSSSSVALVEENCYYSTVLTPFEGDYEVGSVVVTMGGEDVTEDVYRSSGDILITQVTGNVIITAIANAVIYIDDVYTYQNDISTIDVFSDDGYTRIGGINYVGGIFYAKHDISIPAVFTVEIENTTDEAINTNVIYVGSLPTEYGTADGTLINANNPHVYCAKNIASSSGIIAPHSKLVTSFDVKAGRRPIVAYYKTKFIDELTIKIKGAYNPVTNYGEKVEFKQGAYVTNRKYYKGDTTSSELVTQVTYAAESYNNEFVFSASKKYEITCLTRNIETFSKPYLIGLETEIGSTEVFNAPNMMGYKSVYTLPYVAFAGVINGIDGGILTTQKSTVLTGETEYYVKEVQ